MRCDICNSLLDHGEGECVTAGVLRDLLNNGFGIHPSNVDMIESAGMSRNEATEALRNQYMRSSSDWLFCPKCVADAKKAMNKNIEKWIDTEHIAVTRTAEEVGLGYDIIGAPVALSKYVWFNCVEWTKEDDQKQCYQEQDARLWDVLFTGGATLQLSENQFLKTKQHDYSIFCVPRDGESSEAITFNLTIHPVKMHNKHWVVVDFAERSASVDEWRTRCFGLLAVLII